MDKIKVFIADDHAIARAGVKSVLGHLNNIEIVGEASSGRETLNLVIKIQPDILFLDISMPDLSGLDVLERLKKERLNTKIVMLSMFANDEYVIKALKLGADAYLLKDGLLEEIGFAIKSVLKNGKYLTPAISRNIVNNFIMQPQGHSKESESIYTFINVLTSRQREILQLIAEGFSTKDIASKLNISVKTVETHRLRTMQKLNIFDTAGLVRYAVRSGLVSDVV